MFLYIILRLQFKFIWPVSKLEDPITKLSLSISVQQLVIALLFGFVAYIISLNQYKISKKQVDMSEEQWKIIDKQTELMKKQLEFSWYVYNISKARYELDTLVSKVQEIALFSSSTKCIIAFVRIRKFE